MIIQWGKSKYINFSFTVVPVCVVLPPICFCFHFKAPHNSVLVYYYVVAHTRAKEMVADMGYTPEEVFTVDVAGSPYTSRASLLTSVNMILRP
jgi:hypothetical protein